MGDFKIFGFDDFPVGWQMAGAKQIKQPHNLRLTIEFVPSASLLTDIKFRVSAQDWRRIIGQQARKANGHCETCGTDGKKQGFFHNVECHEVWRYDEGHKVQTLKGFVILCPLCHKVKHYDTLPNRDAGLAVEHLMRVNGLKDIKWAKHYLQAAYDLHQHRSQISWTLNLDWLTKKGIQVLSESRKLPVPKGETLPCTPTPSSPDAERIISVRTTFGLVRRRQAGPTR